MSESEEQVITPGGPRPREAVHGVDPGEGIKLTPEGELEVVSQSNGEGDLDSPYVLAPGGRRHRALVHMVEAGTIIDGSERRLRALHPSGEVLADLGTIEVRSAGEPLMPGNVARPHSRVPGLGTGWIIDAGWTNNTGTPISYFATTWIVPPAPTTAHSQTIFLFNGIQNSTFIYQPVLQWGGSAAGGGNYWSIASWYVDSPSGAAFHTNLVRVNPGDTLVGVMTQTGHQVNTNNYSYDCYFQGIANTSLPITNVEQLTWANETLEAYALVQESDYPDTFMTKMKHIDIQTGTTHPAVTWSAQNRVTDIGQHAAIVSNSSTDGEVDLCYRASPHTKAQGLAEYNGRLFASWKGITNDERLFYSSFDGSSWVPQAADPAGGTRTGSSLSVFNNRLYAAWKGIHSDQRLFFSSYDGHTWAAQAQIPGVAGRVGPTLATFNGRLYAAWRGMDSDEAIWFASYNGSSWSAQARIPGVASSHGPSLAVYNGRLYAAWKGMGLDQGLWFASYDGANWSPQAFIPGVASSIGPTLAAYGGRLYAAWKGMGDDQAIWFSSYDGAHWSAQATIPGVGSHVGPILATYGSRLYAMWKGVSYDQRMFYSSFDGHNWAPQQLGPPGATGPDYEF